MEPLELLFEADAPFGFDLPEELGQVYGGSFGLPEPCVYGNFVSTLDGVVAIPSVPASNLLVAGESEADRFVMGLLRACADALVIGAGTLRAAPHQAVWTAKTAYPPATAAYDELRRRLERSAPAELVVVTGSGHLEPEHPSLQAGALVLTTDGGAERLAVHLPAASTAQSVGPGTEVDPRAAIESLRDRGHRLILCEGGPHLFGPFLAAGVVDELFLTLSPLIAGRPPESDRLGFAEGEALLPGRRIAGRLLGVRREGGHLFLRYELAAAPESSEKERHHE